MTGKAALREKARKGIRSGKLPSRRPDRTELTTNNVTMLIIVCVALLTLSVVIEALLPWLSW
jgi:hypothetical protein